MSSSKDSEPKTKRKSSLKKVLLWILLTPLFIFIGLAILGAIITGGKPTNASSKQTGSHSSAPQLPGIGQTVSDVGFNFLINSIKCGETHISTDGLVHYYADAQGQFCRLNVTVTNTGNSANSINVSNQYVYNAKEQRYDYASGATAAAADYAIGTPLNDDINPGNSVTGDIIFDMPTGVTPTTAELHGNNNSRGVKVNLQ